MIRTERCKERGTTRVRRAVRIPLTCRSVCLLGVMSFPSHSFRHASDVRSEGVAKGWKGDDMTGWVGNRREPSGEGPGRNGGKETRNPPFIRHASLISFPSSRLGPGVARAGRNGVRDEPNVMKKRAGIDHSRRHTGPFTSVSAHPRLPLLTPFLRHSRSLRSPRMIETFMNDPFREVKVESSQGEGKGTVTDDQPLSHSSPIICSSLTVPHSFHLP